MKSQPPNESDIFLPIQDTNQEDSDISKRLRQEMLMKVARILETRIVVMAEGLEEPARYRLQADITSLHSTMTYEDEE